MSEVDFKKFIQSTKVINDNLNMYINDQDI